MLLYFRVSNSRSINEEIEISLIAGDYGKKLPKNIYKVPKYGFSVVKMLALYGANASGKSNILKALMDGNSIITKGLMEGHEKNHSLKTAKYYPNKNQNIIFHTPYIHGLLIDNIYYEYQIGVNKDAIISETLWRFEPNNNIPITLFERKCVEDKYSWFFNPIFDDNFITITKSVTNPYTSLLSVAANYVKNNHLESFLFLAHIFDWFDNKIYSAVDETPHGTFSPYLSLGMAADDPILKKAMLKILKVGDFSIKDIKVILDQENEVEAAYTYHINSAGKKIKYDFFTEESAGTQQFFAWLSLWYLVSVFDTTLVLDEFGNNLHPLIAKYLIQLFYESADTQQLIFSTHHTELLDRNEIRDDQVYFVNKNADGNTTVRPLSDYQIPSDILLDKVYLQGIFQGIPFINDKKK